MQPNTTVYATAPCYCEPRGHFLNSGISYPRYHAHELYKLALFDFTSPSLIMADRSIGFIYKAEGDDLHPISFLLIPRRANSTSYHGIVILSPQNPFPFHKIRYQDDRDSNCGYYLSYYFYFWLIQWHLTARVYLRQRRLRQRALNAFLM